MSKAHDKRKRKMHSKPDTHISRIIHVALKDLKPSPFQPRQQFEQKAVRKIARSIKRHGLLDPILVQRDPEGDGYIILAGHLRVEAFKLLKRTIIPAIVLGKRADAAEIPLIENVYRFNLVPIERAQAVDKLMKAKGYTQAEVGKRLGKSQSAIAQLLTLLHLDESIQSWLPKYRGLSLSLLEGLATCHNKQIQDELWQQIKNGKIRTVKDLRTRKNALLSRPLDRHTLSEFLNKIEEAAQKLSRCEGSKMVILLLKELKETLYKAS